MIPIVVTFKHYIYKQLNEILTQTIFHQRLRWITANRLFFIFYQNVDLTIIFQKYNKKYGSKT